MEKSSTLPKVNYNLPYGANAFEIMGGFKRKALRAGWSNAEIKTVLDEAMSGDYNNLMSVIEKHCE